MGGIPFNMLLDVGDPMKTVLRTIIIRCGDEIDAIEVSVN